MIRFKARAKLSPDAVSEPEPNLLAIRTVKPTKPRCRRGKAISPCADYEWHKIDCEARKKWRRVPEDHGSAMHGENLVVGFWDSRAESECAS